MDKYATGGVCNIPFASASCACGSMIPMLKDMSTITINIDNTTIKLSREDHLKELQREIEKAMGVPKCGR